MFLDTFELTHRVISVLPEIKPDHYYEGLKWYQDAHDFAQQLADEFSVPLVQVVGLIATYSINNKWEPNKRAVIRVLGTGEIIGIENNHRIKARAILQTTDPNEIMDILNGDKVRCFFHNILFLRDSTEVTIDRWIARALGIKQSDLKLKTGYVVNLYHEIADVIRSIASLKGIRPMDFQAALWVAVRGSAE